MKAGVYFHWLQTGSTKTVELAYGLTGENVWHGTPTNPKAPVIFECVGVPGMIDSIMAGAPLFSRLCLLHRLYGPRRGGVEDGANVHRRTLGGAGTPASGAPTVTHVSRHQMVTTLASTWRACRRTVMSSGSLVTTRSPSSAIDAT